jgi:hypothetical protein
VLVAFSMDLRSVQICGDAGGILLAHRVSSSVNLRSTAMSESIAVRQNLRKPEFRCA